MKFIVFSITFAFIILISKYSSAQCTVPILKTSISEEKVDSINVYLQNKGLTNTDIKNLTLGRYIYKLKIKAGGGLTTNSKIKFCINGANVITGIAKGTSDANDPQRTLINNDSIFNTGCKFNAQGWTDVTCCMQGKKVFMQLDSKWGTGNDTYITLWLSLNSKPNFRYTLLNNPSGFSYFKVLQSKSISKEACCGKNVAATGISNSSSFSQIRSIIKNENFKINDISFQNINKNLLDSSCILFLANGSQCNPTLAQTFTNNQAMDIKNYIKSGGKLYITARVGYKNVLDSLGVSLGGLDGGSNCFNWPYIRREATQFTSHPLTIGLGKMHSDVGASFTLDTNWNILGKQSTGTDLLALRNYESGQIILWYGQRSHRNSGPSGNVYESDISRNDNKRFYQNMFKHLNSGSAKPYKDTIFYTKCPLDTLTITPCKKITKSGTYHDSLVAKSGCDSIITRIVKNTNSTKYTFRDTICSSDSTQLPSGNFVSYSGIYLDTLQSNNSCDSIIATNIYVKPAYSSHQLLDSSGSYVDTSLIAYLPGNGSAIDKSSYQNNGTLSGVSYGANQYGNTGSAFVLDGSNDKITIPNLSSLPSNFTIQATYKFEKESSNENKWRTFFLTDNYCNDFGMMYKSGGSDDGTIRIYNGNCSGVQSINYPLRDGVWYNVALTYGSGKVTLFINCQKVSQFNISNINQSSALQFGMNNGGSPYGYSWRGAIDDIKIYKRALNKSEISKSCKQKGVFIPPINLSLCKGDSTILADSSFADRAGVYTLAFSATNGCDSIVTYFIDSLPSFYSTNSISICKGDSILSAGGYYLKSPGVYRDTLVAQTGCDSVVTQNIFENPTYDSLISVQKCSSSPLVLPGGDTIYNTGIFTDTLSTVKFCDSILRFKVTNFPGFNDTIFDTICQGQQYRLAGGQWVDSNGVYVDSLLSMYNCDSIITQYLQVSPTYDSLFTFQKCRNSIFILPHGDTAFKAGLYLDTLISSNLCDSILRFQVNNYPAYRDTIYDTICQGQSYRLPSGSMVNSAGSYLDSLQTFKGCDSILITDLQMKSTFSLAVYDTICPGETYSLPGGQKVTLAGHYVDTLITSVGCDSIINTHIYLKALSSDSLKISLCGDQVYYLADSTAISSPGNYFDTLKSSQGCDSILIINLQRRPISIDTMIRNLCMGDSLLLPNGNYTAQEGWYFDTLTSISGCDSIIATLISKYDSFSANIEERRNNCNSIMDLHLNTSYPAKYFTISWSNGKSDSIWANAPSNTKIWATVKDTNGCAVSDTLETGERDDFIINRNFPPVFYIENGAMRISANYSKTPQRWRWLLEDNTFRDSSFLYRFNEVGLYKVKLRLWLTDTCFLDTLFPLEVKSRDFIAIPTAFTPNGDGLNDQFGPVFIPGSQVPYRLLIFSRWGNLVFEGANAMWDGTVDGKPAPGGVYTYKIIETKGTISISKQLKMGHFSLIR